MVKYVDHKSYGDSDPKYNVLCDRMGKETATDIMLGIGFKAYPFDDEKYKLGDLWSEMDEGFRKIFGASKIVLEVECRDKGFRNGCFKWTTASVFSRKLEPPAGWHIYFQRSWDGDRCNILLMETVKVFPVEVLSAAGRGFVEKQCQRHEIPTLHILQLEKSSGAWVSEYGKALFTRDMLFDFCKLELEYSKKVQ